jgi:hypothetical protein
MACVRETVLENMRIGYLGPLGCSRGGERVRHQSARSLLCNTGLLC